MSKNKIAGITVEIGGDTGPLDKSLKDANKTINSTQSELKEVNKLLKFDSSNVTLTKQKQDLLKESISATKEKLDTLKAAQSQVEQQFKSGEIDGGTYRAFQRELESTKKKLSDLKDEKKNVSVIGAAFDEVKDKAQNLQTKLQPIASGLKNIGSAAAKITGAGIKTVGTAVNVAETGLKAYAGTALAAGTAITGMTYSAAKAADDINTIAKQTGLSTEQIQKFQYATDIIDVPLDTLTGSMAKMTKNMATASKGTGDAATAFKTLGINITDQNGQLRDNQEVFNEAITALGEMENGTQRDALAMQIFGKSAQDLNPLILGGADALKVLGDSADDAGLILSQDALDDLNSFNDSVDILKANTGQAGKVISGAFAGGLKEATDIVGGEIPKLSSAFAGIFSGTDTGKYQGELTANLTSLFQGLVGWLNGQIPAFLNGINSFIIALVTALAASLPGLINTLLPALINGFFSLIQGILPQIPVILPLLVDGAMQLFMGLLDGLNLIIPQLMEMLPGIIQQISDILIQNLPLLITAGIQLLINLITGIVNAIPQLVQAVVSLIPVVIQALMDNLPALIQAGVDLFIALVQNLPLIITTVVKAIPQIITGIVDALVGNIDKIIEAGVQLFIALIENLPTIIVEIVKAIPQIIEGIVKALGSLAYKIVEAGGNLIKGLWQGIKDAGAWLWDKISGFFGGIVDKIKGFFGIHSPSTLFRDQLGKNLALGLGEGFTGQMKKVSDEMQKAIPTDFSTEIQAGVNVSRKLESSGNYATSAGRTANYNFTIEKFENNRPQDLPTLMREFEFISRNAEMSRG